MNVITFARSPVIPKATKTSAGPDLVSTVGRAVGEDAIVVINVSSLVRKLQRRRYVRGSRQCIVRIA
jgi:hypothetical protein